MILYFVDFVLLFVWFLFLAQLVAFFYRKYIKTGWLENKQLARTVIERFSLIPLHKSGKSKKRLFGKYYQYNYYHYFHPIIKQPTPTTIFLSKQEHLYEELKND